MLNWTTHVHTFSIMTVDVGNRNIRDVSGVDVVNHGR